MTEREILNHALGLMGEVPVEFFAPRADPPIKPETEGGVKAALFFDAALREVQSQFVWQEILTTADLESDGTDAYGRKIYPYSQITPEVLRPVSVSVPSPDTPASAFRNPQPTDSNIQYEIKGNAVYSYAESSTGKVQLTYVRYETDTTKFGPALVSSVYHKLAALATYSVTLNPDMASYNLELYNAMVRPRSEMTQVAYRTNEIQTPRETGILPQAQMQQRRGGEQ